VNKETISNREYPDDSVMKLMNTDECETDVFLNNVSVSTMKQCARARANYRLPAYTRLFLREKCKRALLPKAVAGNCVIV